MQSKDLVSIIVPVYNVKDYLERCIRSIVNQTYTNIEIILIDDGSNDGSEIICDEQKKYDNRIKVMHQQNQGLSAARNTGIKNSSGKYLSFVDSDDYISVYMIERMVSAAIRSNAKIVCCNYTSKLPFTEETREPQIIKSEEALSFLLTDIGFKCYAWNKLYSRDLFDKILFPYGKCYEDIITTYKLIKNIEFVAYIDQALYYYTIRDGSITHNEFKKSDYDLIEALDWVIADAKNCSTELYKDIMIGYIFYHLTFFRKTISVDITDAKEEKKYTTLTKKFIKEIIYSRNLKLKSKLQIIGMGYVPKAYKFIFKLLH